MKKSYLLLCLLAVACSTFAQNNQAKTIKDLARHPALLTPELAMSIAQHGLGKDGELPPTGISGYNLSDSSYMHTWDGDTWDLSTKRYFTNDCGTGLRLSSLQQDKDFFTDVFNNVSKNEWEYYPNKRSKTTKFFNWSETLGDWLPSYYYEYNEDGEMVETWNTYDFDDDGQYDGGTRQLNTFDANGTVVKLEKFDYDTNVDDWAPYYRVSYFYENGLLKTELEESFGFSNTWELSGRITHDYDANGLELQWGKELYSGSDWYDYQRKTFTYNSQDQLTDYLIEQFDGFEWSNVEKWEGTYHSNGQQLLSQTYTWVTEIQIWVATDSYEWMENGSLLKIENKDYYDTNTNGFEFGFRLRLNFQPDMNISSLINELLVPYTLDDWDIQDSSHFEYDLNGQIGDVFNYSFNEFNGSYLNNTWEKYYNTGCFFSNTQQVGNAQEACAFANPLQAGQAFECPSLDANHDYTLDLFSMTGARVHSQPFQSGQSLTISDLAPGIYLMAIHDGQGLLQRSKVVVGK